MVDVSVVGESLPDGSEAFRRTKYEDHISRLSCKSYKLVILFIF